MNVGPGSLAPNTTMMHSPKNRLSFCRPAQLVILLTCSAWVSASCGGIESENTGKEAPTWILSESTVHCPKDSLEISNTKSPIPSGATVTFERKGSPNIDGGAILEDGSIDCGFPESAPSGDYEVVVTYPGGEPMDVGTISYDQDCPE